MNGAAAGRAAARSRRGASLVVIFFRRIVVERPAERRRRAAGGGRSRGAVDGATTGGGQRGESTAREEASSSGWSAGKEVAQRTPVDGREGEERGSAAGGCRRCVGVNGWWRWPEEEEAEEEVAGERGLHAVGRSARDAQQNGAAPPRSVAERRLPPRPRHVNATWDEDQVKGSHVGATSSKTGHNPRFYKLRDPSYPVLRRRDENRTGRQIEGPNVNLFH
uniref:Uncharacterized protein n=1 Tax=Oryza sativa subsp. japonica TaxID=39947 RepID=Q8LIH4_ORYSJ|nr:hypothetical protein [Oryza sativa Japonica Group]BAD30280.1 hypothetical protein [Oryza sativa Japonica Group]